MNNEFFITGGTLPPNAHSYLTRSADTELIDSLLRGEFCYVLNTRQMGKSSLMSRAAHRLREQGIAVVVLDLTAIGQNLTVEQWYAGLLGRMVQQTGLRDDMLDFWRTHRELGPMQRFLEMLRSVLLMPPNDPRGPDRTPSVPDTAASLLKLSLPSTRKLVIFIDEIDVVRSLPFSADEFFAGIRECYNRRAHDPVFDRLTFCLLGVAAPSDLIQDTRISPFNIGRRIELEDFTPEEARPLAGGLLPPGTQPSRSSPARRWAQRLLKRVLYWTNGHPYMTQRLCREIALQQEQGSVMVGDVDRLCERLFFTKTAQTSDDNLAFVRNRLLKSEADLPALLDMYSQILAGKRVRDEDSNPLCSLLRLSGAVSVERGLLKPRNRVYRRVFDREWVRKRMPDAELRRQERAYRQGIMRTASIAASMLVIISGLAINAYVAEKHATAAAHKADKATQKATFAADQANSLVYAAQMREVQKAYEEDDLIHACDLLEKTKDYPGKGFEWNFWNRWVHQESFTLPTPGPRSMVVYSRDGKWIVTQTYSTEEIPHLDLWDAKDSRHRHLRTIPGRTMEMAGVASPVGADLVAVVEAAHGKSGPVRLIDPCTGATLHTLDTTATAATLSGDGKRVFTLGDPAKKSAGNAAEFKIWDAQRGTLLFTEEVAGKQTFGQLIQEATIQSTSDSRLLAFGSSFLYASGSITLLDTATLTPRWTPPDKFTAYRLSAQGRYLAGGIDTPLEGMDTHQGIPGEAWLWDLQTHHKIRLGGSRRKYSVLNFQFSPDGRLLVGSGGDWGRSGQVWLWDIRTGEERRTWNSQKAIVYGMTFSRDGKSLFTVSSDTFLYQWDLATGAKIGAYHITDIAMPALSPESDRLLLGDSKRLYAYSSPLQKPPPWQTLLHTGYIKFLPDSRHIYAVFINRPDLQNSGTALFKTDSQENTVRERSDFWGLEYSPDGRQMVLALEKPGSSVAAELRDPLTYRLLGALPGTKRYQYVVYSRDGALLTTLVKGQGQVQLWDTRTGKEIARLPPPKGYDITGAITVQRGRKVVCGGSDNQAHVRDVQTGRELYPALPLGSAGDPRLGQIAETTDGNALCLLTTEGFGVTQIAVYDLDTGALRLRRPGAVAAMRANLLSRDGRFLAWGDLAQNVHLTELASGKEEKILHSIGGYFLNADWSPDGKRLVTATLDGTYKLWDTTSGEELMTLPRTPGTVTTYQVIFSPDGTSIAIHVQSRPKEVSTYVWNSHLP